MYWWRVSKLAIDLREGRVDEKERFKYFLATFTAWVLIIQMLPAWRSVLSADHLASVALNLGAGVIGIFLCYMVNKRLDNSDFIPRMICLGWPTAVQYVIISAVTSIGFGSLYSLDAIPFGAQAFNAKLVNEVRGFWKFLLTEPWLVTFLIFFYYLSISHRLIADFRVQELESLGKSKKTEVSRAQILLGIFGGLAIPVFMIGSLALIKGTALGPVFPFIFSIIMLLIVAVADRTTIWLLRSSPKANSCAGIERNQ